MTDIGTGIGGLLGAAVVITVADKVIKSTKKLNIKKHDIKFLKGGLQ